MTNRQTLLNALDHKPGLLPVDFGATSVTGMHVSCVEALREHYGLERRPVKVIEPYQMLGELDADLLDVIGASAVGVPSRMTLFGFPNEDWTEFRTPWGQTVLVSRHFKTTANDDGSLYIYPQGDTGAAPSGHMPAGGYFFDTIIRQQPLEEDKLDPADNCEEFGPVSDADLDYLAAGVKAAANTGRAVVAGLPGTALGDIAVVPAPFLKNPRGIRDVTEWYMSTALRPEYIHAVFEYQVETALANLPRIWDAVGDALDIAFICGTDFGTQTSSFCSTDTFDSLYLPYYKRINDWIHANTTWRTFKHSCGAVEPFMDHFIEAGFDIINPVQCSATGMDPQTLKDRYGDRLTFWGGGVDTQHTLPFGTPEEVRQQVLERCEIFHNSANPGGFVFNAVHNVQARTPVANIAAMIEAAKSVAG